MTKLRRTLRRLLAAALCLAAAAGLGVFLMAPEAEAVDMTIDGSGFTDPTLTTGYMYYWHEGPPPNEGDYRKLLEQNKLPGKYPILLTWDGKYFLNTGAAFSQRFTERYNKPDLINQYLGPWGSNGIVAANYSDTAIKGYIELYDNRNQDTYRFNMDKSGLLANLPFFEDLKANGSAVCMDVGMPTLPYLVPANIGRSYGITSEYLFGTPRVADGGALDFEDNWLVSQTYLWSSALDTREKDWGLGALHMDEKTLFSAKRVYADGTLTYENPITMDYLWDELKRLNPALAAAADDRSSYFSQHYYFGPNLRNKFALENCFWYVEQRNGENIYAFRCGMQMDAYMIMQTGYISDRYDELLGESQRSFRHDKSRLILGDENISQQVNAKYNFQIYYAEPVITSYMQTSFTVQKGQVVNLDGPIVIGPGCAVTVEDGGVLTCTGWVINNGQILVKPGGTMLVQSKTGSAPYGVVNSFGADTESASGRIACDGTMIVMRDCKVVGGGLYGLQFGEGAQVVNYGQLISENLDVYAANTIENRGDTSAVFAGWGLTESGYDLTLNRITGSGADAWDGMGNVQKAAAVKLPGSSVWGARSSGGTVNYERTAPRRGRVTDVVARIETSADYSVADLPDTVPIYYDATYNVYYVYVGGVVYHYDANVGRWVNIGADGSHRIYNYSIRPTEDGYDYGGRLPDGYILSDGRVAYPGGETPSYEDYVDAPLHYDTHARFWWTTAGDGRAYFYEPTTVKDFIFVENGVYYRCPQRLRPPEIFDVDYISTEYWEDMPSGLNPSAYRSDMEESALPPPSMDPLKVQYDSSTYPYYYIYYELDEGLDKLWWNAGAGAFMQVGTYGFYGVKVEPGRVDLNGYTLP